MEIPYLTCLPAMSCSSLLPAEGLESYLTLQQPKLRSPSEKKVAERWCMALPQQCQSFFPLLGFVSQEAACCLEELCFYGSSGALERKLKVMRVRLDPPSVPVSKTTVLPLSPSFSQSQTGTIVLLARCGTGGGGNPVVLRLLIVIVGL